MIIDYDLDVIGRKGLSSCLHIKFDWVELFRI